MDDVERYVINGNISRFVDMLRVETNPCRQDMLKRLLMAEVDRIVVSEERLQILERHLTDGQALIANQRRLIVETRKNGGDIVPTERLLRTFESIQDFVLSISADVHEAMERQSHETERAARQGGSISPRR